MKITSLTKHGVLYAYNKGCRCEECEGLGSVYDLAANYNRHREAVIPVGWEKSARCRGMDPEIFIDPSNEAQARRVCAECEVKETCLSFSIQTKNLAGVYGGVNEVNRLRAYRVWQRRNSKAVRETV